MSDNVTLTEIGRRLRDAAHGAGLTLRELGDKMGVSRPTIYAYASGALRMNDKRVAQAAEITGKPVGYFEPKSIDDLDPRSNTIQSFKLIDALLGPPSPLKATEAARDALEATKDAETPGIRAELLRKLGISLAQTGDFVGAVRQLELALNTFLADSDFEKQASCLQTLGFCYLSLGQIERARECFVAAKEAHSPSSKWKASVALAALSERIGEFASAEEQLSRLLDDPNVDETALTYVRANYSSIVCARGRWKSGLAQSETALDSAFASGLTDQVSELLVQTATALTYLGRLEEATMMVVRARDVAFTLKDEARATLTEVAQARLLSAFDDEKLARTTVSNAYSRALRGQYRRSESQSLLLQAELAYLRLDDIGAQELANQLRSHSVAHQFVVTNTEALIIEAKALSRMGRVREAALVLDEAEELVVRIGEGRPKILMGEARALWNLASGDSVKATTEFLSAAEEAEQGELILDAIRIYGQLLEMAGTSKGRLDRLELEARVERLNLIKSGLCPNPDVWKRFLMGWPLEMSSTRIEQGKKV